jgi:cell division protein FtsB
MSVAPRSLPATLLVGVVAVLLAGTVAVGANGVLRVWEMERELDMLERDLVALRAETERLTATVDRLRNDPTYVEQLARETLGLVRPGDTVLKFPSQPAR